jgi:hypothetical protein
MASRETASLAWTGSHHLQSKWSGSIERVNPVTGGIVGTVPNPFTQKAWLRAAGIAYRPGELWVADMWNDDIVIIDDAGVHIGAVPNSSRFMHMAFMGEKLVGVTAQHQVQILRIERIER